jgi:hypothetical protein
MLLENPAGALLDQQTEASTSTGSVICLLSAKLKVPSPRKNDVVRDRLGAECHYRLPCSRSISPVVLEATTEVPSIN